MPVKNEQHTCHRTIMESWELEGTSEGRLLQLPCTEQGPPQLDQVAQGLIQPNYGMEQQDVHMLADLQRAHIVQA